MGEGNGRWVSARDLQVGARMRLFCLPHAGSGTAGFHRWKAALRGYGVDVCPVMLPGRETRMGERAIEDAGELIAGLIEASGALVDVPYAIYGHSMGALLAFEWARALARAGLAGPVACLWADGKRLRWLMDRAFCGGLGMMSSWRNWTGGMGAGVQGCWTTRSCGRSFCRFCGRTWRWWRGSGIGRGWRWPARWLRWQESGMPA